MKILAIDTTAKTVAAALCEEDTLLGEITVNAKNTHSEAMLPAIERLLTAFSLTPSDVELYALTRGPGSFTGVRIGAATVKGLAFRDSGEAPLPIAAVSTLEALAYNFLGLGSDADPFIAVPVMDARRSQVYTAAFLLSGDRPVRLCDDSALSLDELKELLIKIADGRRILLLGDGYSLAHKYFSESHCGLNIVKTPFTLRSPRGSSIAACGYHHYMAGDTVTEKELTPSYLRGI